MKKNLHIPNKRKQRNKRLTGSTSQRKLFRLPLFSPNFVFNFRKQWLKKIGFHKHTVSAM